MKLLARRAIAFLVDANVYLMLWGVVDNLVAIPIPDGVLELAKGFGFALYVAAFAAISPDAPSLGLRLVRLRIASADDTPLTRGRVVLRGLIAGGMLLTGWPQVVRDFFWIGLPWWAAFLLMAIPRGLFLGGVASALLDRSGYLPYDRRTRTRVIPEGEAAESEAESESEAEKAIPAPIPPRLPATGRLGIAIALVVVSFFLIVQGALLQQHSGPRIPLTDPMVDQSDLRIRIEKMFGQVLLVRSRVGIAQSAHELDLHIWLPWAVMNSETMEQGLQTIFQNLWLNDGTCDTVRVTFWTGQRSTHLALVKPIPIPRLPDDRAIGGGLDTLCVPVPMPPDEFGASVGPDLYEPISRKDFDLGKRFGWRLLRSEGSPPGLIKLTPPYTMNLCIRLTRPGTGRMSHVETTRRKRGGVLGAGTPAPARAARKPLIGRGLRA